MRYTVKQLADLAGVSNRTLHYYDQIGLLKASSYGENGYRYYDEQAVLRLQQILFFRELDFSLAEIQTILDAPEFDMLEALQTHRRALRQRLGQLSDLIETIDRTILHLKGTVKVETKELFEGFDPAQQERYEQEIAQQFGEVQLKESRRRWGSYTPEQKARMQSEAEAIYRDLINNIEQDPASPQVQQAIARWHQHIRYFYEPSREILFALGQAYAEHPEFSAFYQRMHPDMPEFLRQAITHYCDTLPVDAESSSQ